MHKKFIVIGIIIVSIFALGIFKDQVLRMVLTVGASATIQAPVHIDGFSLSLIKQSVRIKGFRIYQPKGYPEGVLLDIPTIAIDYDLTALISGKMHFPLVEIALKEAVIIKSKEGEFNVDSLAVGGAEKPPPKKTKKGAEGSKDVAFQIDILKLKLGRVVSKEYGSGPQPSIKVTDINIDRTYKNITSAQQLISLIIVESMKSAAIRGAKMYGMASLAGVAFLPAGVAAIFSSKDSASDTFKVGLDRAYEAALKLLAKEGTVTKENPSAGIIKAKVKGVNVAFKASQVDSVVEVTFSARKFLIPKKHIAETLLYELADTLR